MNKIYFCIANSIFNKLIEPVLGEDPSDLPHVEQLHVVEIDLLQVFLDVLARSKPLHDVLELKHVFSPIASELGVTGVAQVVPWRLPPGEGSFELHF